MPAPRKDMPALMDAMAELIAEGMGPRAAGAAIGLTAGQAANVWDRIKKGLGAQAS